MNTKKFLKITLSSDIRKKKAHKASNTVLFMEYEPPEPNQ